MGVKWTAAAFAVVCAGCAVVTPPVVSPPPPSNRPGPGPVIPKTRCAPGTPCAPKEASPYRQYYDAHHRRYYYYDPRTRAYYWEDGQPKL